MPRILVLGGTGYIGAAFVEELRARGWDHRVLRRTELDYTQFPLLLRFLRAERFDFLVNCAGYSGKPLRQKPGLCGELMNTDWRKRVPEPATFDGDM